jgi:tetratricopeptide (TPR) repeat protein
MTPSASKMADMTGIRQGALLLLLGVAVVVALSLVEAQRPDHRRAAELASLPKGEYLKVVVLGYRQAVADLIWIKAVQHLGERKPSIQSYLWAYHAADVLTDLDPKFAFVYQSVGTVLGVWAERPNESIAILTKGMAHNPTVWELPFFVGYDYYYLLNQPREASRFFQRAAEIPGSPDYLPRLAVRMSVEAGDHAAALEFLQRLYVQTNDERVRAGLQRRILEVQTEQGIRQLEDAVRQYRSRYGGWPKSLDDLVRRGVLTALPAEPLGGAYELNFETGAVSSTRLKERMRVFRHS